MEELVFNLNGSVTKNTFELSEEELKNVDKQNKIREIDELTNKLIETDYIANKLAEANAEYIVTEDKTKLIELRTKYSKELADRETWRKEIDSLKEKLKNL